MHAAKYVFPVSKSVLSFFYLSGFKNWQPWLHQPFRYITQSISCKVATLCIYSNFVLPMDIYTPHSYIHTFITTHMNRLGNYTKPIASRSNFHAIEHFLLCTSQMHVCVCLWDKKAWELTFNLVHAEPQRNATAAFPAWDHVYWGPSGLSIALSEQLSTGVFDAVLSSV